MNKLVKHSYQDGMNMDITKSKFPNTCYFRGQNIRIISTNLQSTGSVTNEKGNLLKVTIPLPVISNTSEITYSVNNINKTITYTTSEITSDYEISAGVYRTSQTQQLLGYGLVRNNFILFTTDNNGFDCIWKVDDKTYDITLLYIRNLGFNTNNPIQVVNNYENESIDKVYWVDGKAQTRFVNIHHSLINQDLEELIDLSFNNIQIVGKFDFEQPQIIDVVQGGNHTSGMIQYAYNLYRVNGSQTKLSPLTDLVPLNKGETKGGGDVNEIVGSIPVIKIDNLDSTYTNLKLYAIKYTSYNEIPSISLILDRNIVATNEVIYYDDGNIISSLSLEEFTFLGSDIIIPQHINTKKNIMFFANYKEKNFDIDTYGNTNSIDTRAYSFPISSTSVTIYNSLYDNSGTLDTLETTQIVDNSVINGNTKIPYKFSSININYDTNNRQFNSVNVGGEGPYLKYKIIRSQVSDISEKEVKGKFLKDNEIYRAGVLFYNKYGQVSLPKWIADFKTTILSNQSNLNGYYASFELTFKPLFYVWLNTSSNFLDENGNYDESLKPVGYKLLRAERTILDRTIICQGIISGMLSQVNGDTSGDNEPDPLTPEYIARVDNGIKIPSMMRRFDEYLCPMWRNKSYFRVDRFDEEHPAFDEGTFPDLNNNDAANEVYKEQVSDKWTEGTYQFTKLMQLFSPEITFNTIQNLSQSELKVIGGLENDYNASWGQDRHKETKLTRDEFKVYNCIYGYDTKASIPGNRDEILGNYKRIQEHGFFSHVENNDYMQFIQTYRRYLGMFYPSNTSSEEIYGSPLITELGQGRTIYNNDGTMSFYNSLQPLAADSHLSSVNSWGARNITFALGNELLDTKDRKGLEDLYAQTPMDDDGQALVGEFRIPELLIYLGNIYGGNSYESKKRTSYIEIGEYQKIDTNIYNCLHFGDTFVSNFKFTKLVKTSTEVYSYNSEQVTEIVEFRVETTVDLNNRNDYSLESWDNRFQPRDEEYQRYNKVYSQEPNLILRRDLDYKFKRINSFDTNIISSRVKTSGEVIDSWTDLQPNNVITLNGRYGPINALHSFRDEIYTLQDSAIAFISILPRVQISGSDGYEVELGSGKVLQEYRYVSTDSGSKNKWSIVNSPQAFYYFDSINKSINIFKEGIGGLSDSKGLHTFSSNELNINSLEVNNPILKQGVSSTYDFINNCVMFTFLQPNNSVTLSYNENLNKFESFYDYIPSIWISRGNNLLALHPDNNKLYKQFEGDYNKFFDIYYPSYITLLVNPESDKDTILDNIEFKSELYLNGVDQIDTTISKFQLYNEYQDSGLIPLVSGRSNNLRRKFRDWNAILPRNNGTRQRIRNPWNFLKLQLDNTENYKLVLHDILVAYTV